MIYLCFYVIPVHLCLKAVIFLRKVLLLIGFFSCSLFLFRCLLVFTPSFCAISLSNSAFLPGLLSQLQHVSISLQFIVPVILLPAYPLLACWIFPFVAHLHSGSPWCSPVLFFVWTFLPFFIKHLFIIALLQVCLQLFQTTTYIFNGYRASRRLLWWWCTPSPKNSPKLNHNVHSA